MDARSIAATARNGGVLTAGHIEVAIADAAALQNPGGLHNVLIHAPGAAHDDPLVTDYLAVHDAAAQVQGHARSIAATARNGGVLTAATDIDYAPPTAEELGVEAREDAALPVVLVNDGRLIRRNLEARGLDGAWLRDTLQKEGLPSYREAFLLTVDETGRVVCVRKEGEP